MLQLEEETEELCHLRTTSPAVLQLYVYKIKKEGMKEQILGACRGWISEYLT